MPLIIVYLTTKTTKMYSWTCLEITVPSLAAVLAVETRGSGYGSFLPHETRHIVNGSKIGAMSSPNIEQIKTSKGRSKTTKSLLVKNISMKVTSKHISLSILLFIEFMSSWIRRFNQTIVMIRPGTSMSTAFWITSINITLIYFLLVESAKITKKRPKFGALLLLNMPQKSH